MRLLAHSRNRRTRWLAYALLGFCVAFILFGPQLAESGLRMLGCSSRGGMATADCSGISGLIARRLTPFLSTMPPVETGFALIQGFWGLLAIWLGLIVLGIRAGRDDSVTSPPPLSVAEPATTAAPASLAEPERRTSWQAQQAEWIRSRQAEQQAEQAAEQRSLTQRLLAEGLFWGAVAALWWTLLAGLIAFCIAFGTPLLGGASAGALFNALGCTGHSSMVSDPCGAGLAGFWAERLAPYREPFIGAVMSPFWLFTQFGDLLLIWLAALLLLALLPVYRFGWRMVVVQAEHPVVMRVLFILFVLATLALLLSPLYG